MWVEFVAGSNLVPRDLQFQFSSFPPSTKTNISKFQFNQDRRCASNQLMLTCRYKYLFIYFIFHLFAKLTQHHFGEPQNVLFPPLRDIWLYSLIPHCVFSSKNVGLWDSPHHYLFSSQFTITLSGVGWV